LNSKGINLNQMASRTPQSFMDDFLSPYEAEHLINSVKEIDIAEYGSKA
jgi:hypothetical protein